MKLNYYIISILFFCKISSYFALPNDSIKNRNLIKKLIIANIASFEISNHFSKNYNLISKELTKISDYFSTYSPLLYENQYYEIELKESPIKFADSLYKLIEFKSDFEKNYIDGEEVYKSIASLNHQVNLQDKGIIAILKSTGQILYISGEMFLDDVKRFYFKNNISDSSLIEYIRLKYFNYLTENILVNKKSEAYFFSKLTKKKYKVIIRKSKKSGFVEKIKEVK